MELQQSRDEGPAIFQDRVFQNFHLRGEMGFAEQIRLALEPRGELLEVVFIDRREYFAHHDRLPGADDGLPWASVPLRMLNQVVDETASSTPFLHSLPERGVELDTTVENEGSNCLMAEPAGTEECLHDSGGIATGATPCGFETIAHAVVVTQCGENIEPARQNTLARKQQQHCPGAGANCVFPYRRARDGPSV